MTSTSFNIGFGEKKNSSRVLKPPGGGHSDIFGIADNAEMMTPSKKHIGPPTTIKSCFVHDEPDNTKKQNNGHNGNGNVYITPDENIQPDIVIEAEKKKIATPEQPRRVKVPPGGFSTPLW